MRRSWPAIALAADGWNAGLGRAHAKVYFDWLGGLSGWLHNVPNLGKLAVAK